MSRFIKSAAFAVAAMGALLVATPQAMAWGHGGGWGHHHHGGWGHHHGWGGWGRHHGWGGGWGHHHGWGGGWGRHHGWGGWGHERRRFR